MRKWIAVALCSFLALGTMNVAEAGKKEKPTEEVASEGIEIVETGLKDVDDFFAAAKGPIDNITNARKSVDQISVDLNTALGLAEGTPFADALADLKGKAAGKLSVAMNDKGVPAITAEDGVPENVGNAVTALNSGFDGAMAATAELAGLPEKLAALATEGQKFTDPEVLKGLASNPLLATKAIPKITKNLKSLTSAPAEIDALGKSMATLKKSVTTLSN